MNIRKTINKNTDIMIATDILLNIQMRKTKGYSKGIKSLRKYLSLIFIFWGLIQFSPIELNTNVYK